MPLSNDAEIRQLLEQAHIIAVVGYSNRPYRPSNSIARRLKAYGYDVYPVNPTMQSTPDDPIYARLADIPVPIDIVDIFRRSEFVPEVVEAAIAVKARAIWMQLGIVNEEAARRAEEAGLMVVMDRCITIEYARLSVRPARRA
jgi:uncharacterized protein